MEESQQKIFNVLFLCTGNSARSILAEALLNHKGWGRFQAYSAGSHPSGTVRPEALRELAAAGIATEGLRSKSWDEFAASGSRQVDFIVTVCDNAANEQCPLWPGQPVSAHWGMQDPAAARGSEAEVQRAFAGALKILDRRIELLLALPLASFDKVAIQHALRKIGEQ